MDFKEHQHYQYRGRAERLAFFLDSAAYYAALAELIPRAERRILIVGWSFDDRIRLSPDDGGAQSVGDLLISAAAARPSLRVELFIWKPPSLFSADQHISRGFRNKIGTVPNITLHHIPTESAFSSRHEKYLILDDLLAFAGGIDITSARWDTPDHRAHNPGRINPEGEAYGPYHDIQVLFSGPVVRDLFRIAEAELPTAGDWNPAEGVLWPEGLPPDAENAELLLSLTRSTAALERADNCQIRELYLEMIASAREFIYIENQYFSSDEVAEALISRLQRKEGPEIIIIMSRELPDAVGRLTMGINASMHIAKLMEKDKFGRLGFFNPLSPDDAETAVKVHSKMMIVDGRFITLGSANINQRSFSFDSELNILLDAEESDDPGCVAALEERLLARHCGLSLEKWREALGRHKGSRLAALRSRSGEYDGLEEGKNFMTPGTVPDELMDYFDMKKAPLPETALHEIATEYPRRIITWTWRIAGLLLLAIILLGGVFYLARTDIDVDRILNAVEALKAERPVFAGFATVASFWLGMSVLISISMLTVAFAALHGPGWGILYAIVGSISGGAAYYALGLLLHNSGWLERFSVIRRVKRQVEKIKPYGTWAVAISRIIPSAPFLVVNLVTGMLGFRPLQFLAGSLIGLLPGIIAFALFGDTIRRVFTDPGPASIAWFLLLLGGYILLMRGIVVLVKRFSGWKDTEKNE